jgi:hypothetical protein
MDKLKILNLFHDENNGYDKYSFKFIFNDDNLSKDGKEKMMLNFIMNKDKNELYKFELDDDEIDDLRSPDFIDIKCNFEYSIIEIITIG